MIYVGGQFTAIANTVQSCFAGITASVTSVSDRQEIRGKFELYQNYPNPFNPSTTINYQISTAGIVSLKVYDILGREVAVLVNEEKPAGSYKVEFNAGNLSSGIYFYKLRTNNYTKIMKLVLIK